MPTNKRNPATKPGAQAPASTAVGGYTVDDLAAAFKRAGLDIQWVGRDQGKPMTVGSLELTELLKVVAELPARAPAAQSPLPTSITQAARADLFADAIARLAAHDHAAATDLADKYRASLTVPERANELKVAEATLERAYEIIGVGADARKPSILLTNIENAVRRTACLSRIESIMTTLRIEDGEEVEECPMNWGARPDEYAEQFKAALDQRGSGVQVVPVTGYGQVQKGDVLLVNRGNEFVAPVEVKDVLQAGTEGEEIILSAAKNVYFIVRKFLAGESWIKECSKLVNGRIYSITNNQRDILCNSRDDRAGRTPRATAAEEDLA